MIEPHVPIYLVAAALMVAGNAFFDAAEFAIVKVRTTRIEEMATSAVRRLRSSSRNSPRSASR